MESSNQSQPRLGSWLAGLVSLQIGLSGLLYGITSLLNHSSSGSGITAVGHFLGAQTLGSFLDRKYPGRSRPSRQMLSLSSMTVQVGLGLVYYLAFGLPDMGVTVDPKKRGMLALIVVPVTSAISFSFTWLGLTSGIRLMEKQRARTKK